MPAIYQRRRENLPDMTDFGPQRDPSCKDQQRPGGWQVHGCPIHGVCVWGAGGRALIPKKAFGWPILAGFARVGSSLVPFSSLWFLVSSSLPLVPFLISIFYFQFSVSLLPRRVQFEREDSGVGLEVRVGSEDGPVASDGDGANQDVGDRYGDSAGAAVVAGFGRGFVVGRAHGLIREGAEDAAQLFVLAGRLDAG